MPINFASVPTFCLWQRGGRLVLLGLWLASLSLCHAEALVVTNIAQLRELVRNDWRLACALNLTGVVCAVSAPQSAVILTDATGAEFFTLDFQGQDLRVGQELWLSAADCEVTRRRMGLVIRRAPLVNNDGLHPAQERSATISLPVGKHPFFLEWFNAGGAAALGVECEGPGVARQPIPGQLLYSQPVRTLDGTNGLVQGLTARAYMGNWPEVPDFGEWPVVRMGVVSNCGLAFNPRAENSGVTFSGLFEAPQDGDYTFHVRSDDGSLLFVGPPLPQLQVISQTNPPVTRKHFIGQVLGVSDTYRWAQAEGNVRYLVERSGRLEFDLQSRTGNRMQIEIADGADLPPELLVNSQIRIAGVNREVLIPGGQRIFGLLSAMSRRDLQFVEVAPEVWSAFPLQTIAELRPASAASQAARVVQLSGKLRASRASPNWVLGDETGEISVERSEFGAAFLGKQVQVIGVLPQGATNLVLQNPGFRPPSQSMGKLPLPVLTTAEQVLRLGRDEAQRRYPVLLRGVVTCTWPGFYRNAVLQDGTRGVFTALPDPDAAGSPKFGEFWEMEGVTAAGIFSPILTVQRMTRLSEGRMPAAVQPTWDQLLNGSLDALFVEIEGIIIRVDGSKISLLTHWGKIMVDFAGERPAGLEQFGNKLVRIRGCLLAVWDEKTHQVKVGELRIGSATISTDQTIVADPFAAPLKSVGEMLQFDIQASTFQRVKLTGQILQEWAGEFFMLSGADGVRFVPREVIALRPGDLVEVAGIPELGGPSPILREAFVRKTGAAALPMAKRLAAEGFLQARNDATRVMVEGVLVSMQSRRAEQVLEIQSGLRTFTARLLERDGLLPPIAPRSKLALAGVYVGQFGGRVAGQPVDNFELLLGSVQDVTVLDRPPWWTLRKLLAALGVLMVVLVGAMLWVIQLRRRVEVQTRVIRENVQQTATLEERSRIARELHDTLEQSLAGVSFQLGALAGPLRGVSADATQMLERARMMVQHGQEEARRSVRNLRTFALERSSLSAALEEMARNSVNGMPVQIETVISGDPIPLAYQLENHLLRIGQEALTNALKHGKAHAVKFELSYDPEFLQLKVTDNGCGFDVAQTAPTEAGHFGLLGMRERVNKLGGTIQITSIIGMGTTVVVKVPCNQTNSDPALS